METSFERHTIFCL